MRCPPPPVDVDIDIDIDIGGDIRLLYGM